MSFSFVIGNLLGRALVSYVLVWIACLAGSRFDWRKAFARSGRWYSVLAVIVLTLLGLGGALAGGGGGQ
ncbi:MAG: hypothetical protein AB1584_22075 [Pseudomonadota bacterium]